MEVLCFLPSTHYPLYDFDLRTTHACTLLPAAVASVSFGFVLVRVRANAVGWSALLKTSFWLSSSRGPSPREKRLSVASAQRLIQDERTALWPYESLGLPTHWSKRLDFTSYLRFWLARNARAYTSARSIGFCAIWVCISSSSSSSSEVHVRAMCASQRCKEEVCRRQEVKSVLSFILVIAADTLAAASSWGHCERVAACDERRRRRRKWTNIEIAL